MKKLSPERLAEIRERDRFTWENLRERPNEFNYKRPIDDRSDLLAHIEALEAEKIPTPERLAAIRAVWESFGTTESEADLLDALERLTRELAEAKAEIARLKSSGTG